MSQHSRVVVLFLRGVCLKINQNLNLQQLFRTAILWDAAAPDREMFQLVRCETRPL